MRVSVPPGESSATWAFTEEEPGGGWVPADTFDGLTTGAGISGGEIELFLSILVVTFLEEPSVDGSLGGDTRAALT